jgi:cytidylate kinase
MEKINVAIDGHSSGGKSTLARELAHDVGYLYIDSGAMYRALTLYTLQHAMWRDGQLDEAALQGDLPHIRITFQADANGRHLTCLNGQLVEKDIRSMEVAQRVSVLAAIGFVRRFLVAAQQAMGKDKGVVMDGRDIGTVVFPTAELKVFVTASPDVRAKRRVDELQAAGGTASYAEVLDNIRKRDLLDSTRTESPLRQAPDAILLDNSLLTRAEQRVWLRARFDEAIRR